MKKGKIAEPVCKRSVLKYVKQNQKDLQRGMAARVGCAFFSCQTVSFPVEETLVMRRAIHAAVNDLAAKGRRAESVTLAVTLPERVRESKLANMMQEAADLCTALGVTIAGGHTLVTDGAADVIVSATAHARPDESAGACDEKADRNICYDGCDILVTGYIGADAVSLIARARQEELLLRFPKRLVEKAMGFEAALSVGETMRAAEKAPVENKPAVWQTIREGGIFAALWELSKKTGAGLTVELKKIPMDQTVVEICNFYDINPYELLSTGCLLAVAADGEALLDHLLREGIPAAVIGRLHGGNDKIITNEDEIRYLDLPKPDQIRKILSHEAQMAYLSQGGRGKRQPEADTKNEKSPRNGG